MIPIGRAAFFAAGGFDPSIYPGFVGDWLVDLATLDGSNNVVSIDSGTTSDPMLATGVVPTTAWPAGVGGIASVHDNLAARTLNVASVKDGSNIDWDGFIVTSPASSVADANNQWEFLIGTFGAPVLGGIAHMYSFASETRLYDQIHAWVDQTAPLAGPQVLHIRRRSLETPNTKVWRNDVLILQGDTDAIECNMLTVASVVTGAPLGPGFQFEGLFKRLCFYSGSGLSDVQGGELRTELGALYV